MKLFVLAVFLTVVQAPPPAPQKTTDNSAPAAKRVQKPTTSDQPTPASPLAPDVARATPKEKSERTGEAAEKNPDSIRISDLPAVTVNGKRDFFDWGSWLFNFLLVVVGGLQALLLCLTLRLIRHQAFEMTRQRIVMRGQLGAMQDQLAKMTEAGKQTERIISQMKDTEVRDVRAYVGVSKILLNLLDPRVPRGIVEVRNFGKTPAYKVRQWVAIAIHSHPLTVVLPESSNPKNASVSVIFPNIANVNMVDLKKPIPAQFVIGTPQLTIYVYGKIIYEDIFGNERYSNYRFIFGGSGGGQTYTEDGVRMGTMGPDSEGNDAT